jgi:hypothetical protein
MLDMRKQMFAQIFEPARTSGFLMDFTMFLFSLEFSRFFSEKLGAYPKVDATNRRQNVIKHWHAAVAGCRVLYFV